jgi:hypothetical protein
MRWKIVKNTSLALMIFESVVFAEDEGYWDLLTDFVYMERYHVKDQTLSVTTFRDVTRESLNVKDLASGFGFEPGLQAYLSYIVNPRSSYELGFVYVWDWENTKTRTSDTSSLSFPFKDDSFARDFFEVSEIQAYYKSQFYTVDLNYTKAFSESRDSYLSFSGVGGIRFASLKEKFSLTASEEDRFGEFDIKTTNNLIGIQIGFAFQINAVKAFHWDLDGKVGVGLNRISADSFLGDQNNTVQLRNFSKLDWQSNIFATAAAGFGYRALSFLDIHAGYEMLYLCGLALAPDQIDTSTRTTHFSVDNDGYVIVHGLYVGLLYSF